LDEATRDRPEPAGKNRPADGPESDLTVGGHEPAPASKDPAAAEARDAIQDAFDDLEATHASDAVSEAADASVDQNVTPGTKTGDTDGGVTPAERAGGSTGNR
jgi:hypothetical protein